MHLPHLPFTADISLQIPNAAISVTATVAPTGVDIITDIIIPAAAQMTESAAENIITGLKLLNRHIAESAGKTTSAEISSEPTSFMASTITTAVITAVSVLYAPALTPAESAKSSSKVTAKILL